MALKQSIFKKKERIVGEIQANVEQKAGWDVGGYGCYFASVGFIFQKGASLRCCWLKQNSHWLVKCIALNPQAASLSSPPSPALLGNWYWHGSRSNQSLEENWPFPSPLKMSILKRVVLGSDEWKNIFYFPTKDFWLVCKRQGLLKPFMTLSNIVW